MTSTDRWHNAHKDMMDKNFDNYVNIGFMGSHVGLDEGGNVVARALEKEEILKLISLYDTIEEIPKEFTIIDCSKEEI